MMMVLEPADRYMYQVVFSDELKTYEATCVEFPRLSHADVDMKLAFDGIRELVDFVIKQMQARGQSLPPPTNRRETIRRTDALAIENKREQKSDVSKRHVGITRDAKQI